MRAGRRTTAALLNLWPAHHASSIALLLRQGWRMRRCPNYGKLFAQQTFWLVVGVC